MSMGVIVVVVIVVAMLVVMMIVIIMVIVIIVVMVTMLLLLGPAIEDSAGGKDVLKASAMRVALFVAVALYAWGTVWVLERWRAARSRALFIGQG